MAASMRALVVGGAIKERRLIDIANIPAHKQALWLPVVEVGNTTIDPLTQKKTGPVTTIEATQVVDTWTVSSKTAQEILNEKQAAASALNGAYRLTIKGMHDLDTRIRARETPPQAARTLAEYETYLASLG